MVYKGPGKVAVESIPFPKLELAEQKRKCEHGVILKVRSCWACVKCGRAGRVVEIRNENADVL